MAKRYKFLVNRIHKFTSSTRHRHFRYINNKIVHKKKMLLGSELVHTQKNKRASNANANHRIMRVLSMQKIQEQTYLLL